MIKKSNNYTAFFLGSIFCACCYNKLLRRRASVTTIYLFHQHKFAFATKDVTVGLAVGRIWSTPIGSSNFERLEKLWRKNSDKSADKRHKVLATEK